MHHHEIITLFEKLALGRNSFSLLNVFKGVPVSYPASIVHIRDSWIRVRTEKYQVVCLYRERETYIQSTLFPEVIKARVTEIDFTRLEATLSGFEVIDNIIGARTLARVQPKELIEGDLRSQETNWQLRCELADISQNGLGLSIPAPMFSPRHLQVGSEVSVTLHLPSLAETAESRPSGESNPYNSTISRFDRENLRNLHLPTIKERGVTKPLQPARGQEPMMNVALRGTIVNIGQVKHNRYRIGIEIGQNDPSRIIISRFIVKRQTEIIREIKAMFDMLSQFDNDLPAS